MELLRISNKQYIGAQDTTLKMYVDEQDALIRDTHVFIAGQQFVYMQS